MFKISQFLISYARYAQRIYEIYENLHHTKVSRYTVSTPIILHIDIYMDMGGPGGAGGGGEKKKKKEKPLLT